MFTEGEKESGDVKQDEEELSCGGKGNRQGGTRIQKEE